MSELVFGALAALGPAANNREVALVASALRESGDQEALALFRPLDGAYFDREACDAVAEIALRAGAGPFVALDLYTEVIRPGWSPSIDGSRGGTEASGLRGHGSSSGRCRELPAVRTGHGPRTPLRVKATVLDQFIYGPEDECRQ